MDLFFLALPQAMAADTGLQQVQRFFTEGFTLDAIMPWAIGLACVIGVLTFALISIIRRRRPFVPQDWIVDPREILALLEQALDQRARFELRFSAGQGGRRPALRCAGARLEGRFLVLEALGLKRLSEGWMGRQMDCFFQVTIRGTTQYYAFYSTLESIRTSDNYCFIRIPAPDRIESRQKRSYLRIVPPEEFLLGAALWHSEALPKETEYENLTAWPRPSLAFLPAITSQVLVRDLSAGGARVYIPKDSLAETAPHVKATDHVMFMVDLWDPDKSKRVRFWMLCRVQNPMLDFQTQGLELGLQFLAWARPRETGESGLLEWLRMARSGEIEPLGNWIMRRHLELFREAEQELGDASAKPSLVRDTSDT